MQIDVVCRDREVRGKETKSLFEDGSLFCLVTDPHRAVAAIIVLSAGKHHQGSEASR